jgi:hypothetical protein
LLYNSTTAIGLPAKKQGKSVKWRAAAGKNGEPPCLKKEISTAEPHAFPVRLFLRQSQRYGAANG